MTLIAQVNAQINTSLQQQPNLNLSTNVFESSVNPTQQAHFQWLSALAQARSGVAQLNVMHSIDEHANTDLIDVSIAALATTPIQPLAASADRLFALKHTANAIVNGDMATVRLLQLMHPHPLSLCNDPDYIDDDILDNGVFLREQVAIPKHTLQPEILHDLYVDKYLTKK